MAEKQTKPQELVVADDAGRLWLYLDLLTVHDEYVLFIGADGEKRLDLVSTWDVFEWRGVNYEVQGFDRPRRRAWVEEITDKLDVPLTTDTINGRPRWSGRGRAA